MKKLLFLFILILLPMLASAQTVSDVQNSGCLNETRGEDSQRVPTIVLTKEGSTLSVQLLNYEENCGTTDFIVTPKVSTNESEPCIVTVNIDPVIPQGYWCICPFNVSFSVHDLEPNSFYLDCWWYKGMVELTEGESLVLEYNNPNTPKYFPTGMTWEEIVVDPFMEQENVNACIYEIGTDTIIGDITYKKVLKDNVFSDLCVRESGDKVWLLAKEYPTEILLYNFDWDSNQEIVTEYLKGKPHMVQDEEDYEVRQETIPVGDSQTVEIEGRTYQYIMQNLSGTIIRGIGKVAELNRYPCLLSHREPAEIPPGLDYHKVHWIKRNGVEIFRSESAKEWIEEIKDDYRPFVEEGKVWKVGSTAGISDGIVKMVDYYYFDGDTIINGKTCMQMMCQRYVSPNHPDYAAMSQIPSLRYVGAWYEEDKKVYIYNAINQFRMTYDFSLEANDTLFIDNQPYVIGPKQTGGLEGFKGVYRDIMWCFGGDPYYNYNTTWLEGVGGIDGPTVNVYSGEVGHGLFLMSCVVGDEVIYLNDEYEDGATPEGVRKKRFDFTHTIKTKPKARIKREKSDVYINSSERDVARPKVKARIRRGEAQSLYGEYNDQQLGINLDPLDDAYQVSITDESDKVVYEKIVNAGSIVALNIDISAYAKGLYTVTVENNSESFTGEFETETTGIDVDGDGILTAKDITAVVNVIAGKITDEAIMSAADVNGDGVVNVADIIKIANEIIGK